MKLEHCAVHRGGITANYMAFETRECTFSVDASRRTLNLNFCLASKGGGTTAVHVAVGIVDLPGMLSEISEKLPMAAPLFADASSRATTLLTQAHRESQNDLASLHNEIADLLYELGRFADAQHHERIRGWLKFTNGLGVDPD